MKDWDLYFLDMAEAVAKQNGSCLRRQFGAILVRPDKSIISTGYNGAPQGMLSCGDLKRWWRDVNHIPSGTQIELCYAVHAEQNALAFAAKHGTAVGGATCYVTANPCPVCLRLLVQSGVKRIVYRHDYPVMFPPYHETAQLIKLEKYGETKGPETDKH